MDLPNAANNSDQPAPQRSIQEYLQSNKTVKIYVGPERKLWFLNEELLCDHVPFFKSAFKSSFKEGKSKVMELPDDDPEAFGHLVNWVYTDVLACKWCVIQQYSRNGPNDQERRVHDLQWLKLWILADKLNLPELAANCLRAFSNCLDNYASGITPEAVKLACEHTSEDSELRKHLVKEVAECVLFRDHKFVGNLGVSAAANASFNQQVMEEIQKNYLRISQDGRCTSFMCPTHNPERDYRGRPW